MFMAPFPSDADRPKATAKLEEQLQGGRINEDSLGSISIMRGEMSGNLSKSKIHKYI